MGTINLAKLPQYLTKWGVRFETYGDWLTVGRLSGGMDSMRGIIIHHSASPTTAKLSSSITYNLTGPSHPIASGILSRDRDGPKLVLYAGLATNHAGKGGPMLSSRGTIAQDAANRVTVGYEAENNGTTEQWSPALCDLYVLVCVATLDWANNETFGAVGGGHVDLKASDVHSHREWAPTRKIDPAGPSRWSNSRGVWDMNKFRAEVAAKLAAGPPVPPPVNTEPPVVDPNPPPPPDPNTTPYAHGTPEPVMEYEQVAPQVSNLVDVLTFWGWMPPGRDPAGNVDLFDNYVWQGVVNAQLALGVPADGVWNGQTARAYSDFVIAMAALKPPCSLPPPLAEGATGPDVEALQRFLASNNWYPYRIDGSYGPRTAQGVQQLQKYALAMGQDVIIDGQFSQRTRDAVCPLV